VPLLFIQTPRVTEATDENGRSLLAISSRAPFFSFNDGINAASLSISLKAPDHRGGKITRLKGSLPVEVMVRPQGLVTVPDLGQAQGKIYRGGQGHQLHVESVQSNGNLWTVNVRLSGPPGWRYNANQHGLELIDAHGRVLRLPYLWLQESPLHWPQPEDLAWLMAAPLAPSLLQVPWPTLARQRFGEQRLEWRGTLQRFSPVMLASPVRLRLYRYDHLKAELPFELRDVPLP
jgi:hypothetical protein